MYRLQETADFIRGVSAHTGDKGYYDEKEHVFVLGRYKELIKYRNAHVWIKFPYPVLLSNIL